MCYESFNGKFFRKYSWSNIRYWTISL
jgi:hypothetical protein